MFLVELTSDAVDDLQRLRKFDQKRIVESIDRQLTHHADQESRNRKRLRPNQLAEWELRIGRFRVFYDVEQHAQTVRVVAIGEKIGEALFVHGDEFAL